MPLSCNSISRSRSAVYRSGGGVQSHQVQPQALLPHRKSLPRAFRAGADAEISTPPIYDFLDAPRVVSQRQFPSFANAVLVLRSQFALTLILSQ